MSTASDMVLISGIPRPPSTGSSAGGRQLPWSTISMLRVPGSVVAEGSTPQTSGA